MKKIKKTNKSNKSKKKRKLPPSFHAKKKKILKRKKILLALTKIHASFTLLAILLYATLGIFGGPEFFLRDFSKKYEAVAAEVQISLRIVGPPAKPVVSATAACNGSDPVINLDWEATNDTDNYDIYRNTLPLISGVTDTEYQDINVQPLMNYDYYIIANGPYGSTPSDSVSVTTLECFAQITPTCIIQTINGKSFSSYDGIPKITDRTPRITGTTNIANAMITIDIEGETDVHATLYANANGYWSWTASDELQYGSYKVTVTATDPTDPSRTATADKKFKIVDDDEEEEEEEEEIAPTPVVQPPVVPPIVEEKGEIKVQVENPDKTVYTGEELLVSVKVNTGSSETEDLEITYTITDKDGNVVKTWTETVTVDGEKKLEEKVPISDLMESGTYKIEAKTKLKNKLLTAEDHFYVKEKVILKLGGGTTVTLTQIMENLSWAIIFLLLFLLLFLILLSIEHHLSKQALFHITEEYLRDAGVISKRKGVSR